MDTDDEAVRRITICTNHVILEDAVFAESDSEQISLFTDYAAAEEKQKQERAALEKENRPFKRNLHRAACPDFERHHSGELKPHIPVIQSHFARLCCKDSFTL